MLSGFSVGTDIQEDNQISVSELFHENSKQQRYDLAFSRRISFINNSTDIHQIISQAFKTYPGATVVTLPEVKPSDGLSFEKTVVQRRSIRDFTGEPLNLIEVAKLLYFGYGITGALEASGHYTTQLVRAAPSGGALYPVELYIVISAAERIEPGIYHYAVAKHALEQLKLGSYSQMLGGSTYQDTIFSRASATVILTIMFGRTHFKYGERGYRFALLETGHIAQNILLTATSLGLGAVAVGGFVDDEINETLDIDGVDEASIYMVAVGRPSPSSKDRGVMEAQSMVDTLLEMLWKDQISFDNPVDIPPQETSAV